jgi:hypothetical protein
VVVHVRRISQVQRICSPCDQTHWTARLAEEKTEPRSEGFGRYYRWQTQRYLQVTSHEHPLAQAYKYMSSIEVAYKLYMVCHDRTLLFDCGTPHMKELAFFVVWPVRRRLSLLYGWWVLARSLLQHRQFPDPFPNTNMLFP